MLQTTFAIQINNFYVIFFPSHVTKVSWDMPCLRFFDILKNWIMQPYYLGIQIIHEKIIVVAIGRSDKQLSCFNSTLAFFKNGQRLALTSLLILLSQILFCLHTLANSLYIIFNCYYF